MSEGIDGSRSSIQQVQGHEVVAPVVGLRFGARSVGCGIERYGPSVCVAEVGL